MKFKKIMLITLLLLAILTIGAVSASDEISDENLTVSEEADMIQASDSDDLSSQDDMEELLTDERKEVDYDIKIPESVRSGDLEEYEYKYPSISYYFYDYDVTGNFSILIDNKTYYTAPVTGYFNTQDREFALNNLNLTYGTHFVQVKYDGDEKYLPFNKTGYFDYYYMKLEVPDPVNIGYWNDQQIMTYFTLNATGTLKVWIDNRVFTTIDVYERRYNDFDDSLSCDINIDLSDYDDLTLGNHSYKITYTGGNYPDKIFEGNFTVDYIFSVDNWGLQNNDIFYLGEEIEVSIYLPDTTGTLILTLNGNEYPIEITDDVFSYILPELEYGQNTLIFTYTHSIYPQKQITFNANASSAILKDDSGDVIYNGGINNYTLLLPRNANGNLSIYKRGEYNSELGDYELGDLIKTAQLVDGRASIGADDLSLGYHNVIVIYTGEDYEIRRYEDNFIVYPNVVYSKVIYSESEDNNVVVKLPENTENNLTISIYKAIYDDSYVPGDLIQQLYNGSAKATITQTIPKLEAENYFIIVDYYGAVQSILDKKYFFTVRDENPQWEMIFSIPQELEIDFDFENEIGMHPDNYPDECDGVFVLYIDDIPVDMTSIDDDYPYYDYSHLTVGEHTWRLEFVNDTYYKPTSVSGTFNIIKNIGGHNIHIYDFYYNDWDDYFADIYLPDDAQGNVKIIVDGTIIFNGSISEFDYEYYDDCFRVTVGSVEYDWQEKSYTITVIYEGEDYSTFSETETVEASFSYSVGDIFINVFDEVYKNDEDGVIAYVNAPDDAAGNIIVKINGEQYYKKSIGSYDYGDFNIYLTDLTKELDYGTYDIEIVYDGEDYESNNPKSKLEVTYSFYGFIDNGRMDEGKIDLDYGVKYYFEVELPEDATGTLAVLFNGKTTPVAYNESHAKYLIDTAALKIGDYTISAIYTQDNKYPDKTIRVNFTVIPKLSVPWEISANEQDSFTVSLPSDATGTLTLYEAVYDEVNDDYSYTKISSVEVKNGKASIMMPKITRYTKYLFEFNSTSYSRSILSSVSVYNNSPGFNVTVTPNELNLGEKVQISFESPVDGLFAICVDDGENEYVNLVNRHASKTLTGLSAGEHKINIKFIDDYDNDKFYSNTFYVTVKDSTKPAPAPAPKPATKPVQPAKKVVKLTLKKVKVKRSAKKLILTATLKINGKWAKNIKITFKFNGKKYNAKTNKKGVAKVTIKKNILKKLKKGKKVKYQASYGKTTKKLTVKVAK